MSNKKELESLLDIYKTLKQDDSEFNLYKDSNILEDLIKKTEEQLEKKKMSKLTEEEKRFKRKALKVIQGVDEKELTIQEKILKLLDQQMKTLEEEVNLLKFKLSHNKMSNSELEIVYEQLKDSFIPKED